MRNKNSLVFGDIENEDQFIKTAVIYRSKSKEWYDWLGFLHKNVKEPMDKGHACNNKKNSSSRPMVSIT